MALIIVNTNTYAKVEVGSYEFVIQGVFTDAVTGEAVEDVEVEIINKGSNQKTKILTNAAGIFRITVHERAEYTVEGFKPMYMMGAYVSINTENRVHKEVITTNFMIDKIQLDQVYILRDFQFEINSHKFDNKSEYVIHKVAQVLKSYPDYKIKLSVHSDSRGNDAYNLRLTQNQAESIRQLLISNGIAKEKIIATGLGEDQLTNYCENGVRCSTESHLQNRRVEFSFEL